MQDPIESKIITLLSSYYPDLDCTVGSPFYEYVVRPAVFIWQKHQQGAEELMAANNLASPDDMPEEDLDRMLTRYFESRKHGDYVYGVVRMFFNEYRDYSLQTRTIIKMADDREYEAVGDYVSADKLLYSDVDGYFYDFSVVSIGTGNTYNAYALEPIQPSNIIDPNISAHVLKAYFVTNTTDGGIVENNRAFYERVRASIGLKNLTTYRGVTGTLLDKFNIIKVTPIGIRDPEMRRDLIDLPNVGIVHKGGCADFYVQIEPMTISNGYLNPLGFPYEYKGHSLATNPTNLMLAWNADLPVNVPSINAYERGSVKEEMGTLSINTNMKSITSNIRAVHDFVTNTDYEAIHTDNLVKQMWPLMVLVDLEITDERGAEAVSNAKTSIIKYINSLKVHEYPKEADIIHAIKDGGLTYVHLPMYMSCYYLNEKGRMERIATGMTREPYNSTLRPLEVDSLRFAVDTASQMSQRTCRWLTMDSLVNVRLR